MPSITPEALAKALFEAEGGTKPHPVVLQMHLFQNRVKLADKALTILRRDGLL